jgi:hypothetical protein
VILVGLVHQRRQTGAGDGLEEQSIRSQMEVRAPNPPRFADVQATFADGIHIFYAQNFLFFKKIECLSVRELKYVAQLQCGA